jgi:hypothetical protein
MANGNKGIGSYLPFPTFGGEKSPGIMPVQLQPSPMRFPTPRALQRRALEPTTKEKLAPFAPLLVEGLGSLIKGRGPDPMEGLTQAEQDDAYLTSIGANIEDPTKMERARLDAYKIFGARDEPEGWGTKLAHMAAGFSMGRGAADYADTYFALRKSKATKETAKETARADFIKSRTDASAQFKNFVNTNDAALGVNTVRWGIQDPDDFEGPPMIHTKDGFVKAGPEWVLAPALGEQTMTPVEIYADPQYDALLKMNNVLQTKEVALGNTVNIGGATIEVLQEGIDDPSLAGATTVAAVANFLNDVRTNYNQITASFKRENGVDFIDATTGTRAAALKTALDTGTFDPETGEWNGDVNALDIALASFEESTGFSLKEKLGALSYNQVALKANFLQLAYMAAATAGQTGRTLSDKDLAFFLQIAGYGASQDPVVQKDNLLRFIDSSILNLDTEVQMTLRKGDMGRFNMNKPQFQAVIGAYYVPKKENWLDYSDYRYKPFIERNKGISPYIDKWYSYKGKYYKKRQQATEGIGLDTVDTSALLKEDLSEIEKLY